MKISFSFNSAQDCPGEAFLGNDGYIYISKRNAKGIYAWKKASSEWVNTQEDEIRKSFA